MSLEELGRDGSGRMSSQPVIRRGPNRGRRKPEPRGAWICAGGYCYEERQGSKGAHTSWIRAVQTLGHRVGVWDCEGVRNFYIFSEAGAQ